MDRKRMVRISLILFAAWFFIWMIQNRLIFHPFAIEGDGTLPVFPGRNLEWVTFKTTDGLTLSGIWMETIPGSATPDLASETRPIILFSHGNAGNLLHCLSRLQAFSALPVDVFAYDYRGFGRSEGSPSVPGVLLDAEAAMSWLEREKGISRQRIILYGQSLGTGVSVALGKRLDWKIAGLVLEAGFRSLAARAGQNLPVLGPLALACDLPSDSLLPGFQGPLLILHSRQDEVNAFSDSERLFHVSSSPGKKLLAFEGYDHNAPLWEDPRYFPAWRQFLAGVASLPRNP